MHLSDLLKIVEDNNDLINTNRKALEIYEGDLHKYIYKTMEKTLSKNYFDTIKERIIPINVLTRIIEKLAKVYAYDVKRESNNFQDFVDEFNEFISTDDVMLEAEEISFLHKGFLLSPYLDHENEPKVRVLPYDRFLPLSNDRNNPQRMTGVIIFMGKVGHEGRECNLFHYWSDSEFIPFTDNKMIYEPDLIEGVDDGSNPMGFIPYVYGNRAKTKLIPNPDSDMLKLSQIIPIVLSDLGGAIMYQCFTILYGIDVKTANLKMSPNAFWDIKSDPKSEKTPEIGSIKPEADVDKVLEFVRNIFTLWVETKGVRVGSIGTMDGGNSSSGISKIIDEMDTSEVRKKSMKKLRKEEKELWYLLARMNNYWIESVEGYTNTSVNLDEFDIQIEYTEFKPQLTRKELFETVHSEYKEGYLDARGAIEKLYPELEGDALENRINELEERSVMPRIEFNEIEENGNS